MKYSNSIEPATALKTSYSELIRRARESRSPIVLTEEGKASAVLQDITSFEQQRHSLLMLRYVLAGLEDHEKGRVVSDEEADGHFRQKLAELRSGG